MKSKLATFAMAGIFGLNLSSANRERVYKTEGASPSGFRQDVKDRVQDKIEKFENTRGVIEKGKVTAKTDSTITIDNNGTAITVNITSDTKILRKFWGKGTLTEISVGDSVSIVGKWTDDTKTAINAVAIRDLSIQKRFGVFFGEVKSLTSNGFVFTSIHRDDETVTIGSAKLVNRKGDTITQADIKVGDKIRVRGMWDSANKTITETVEIKNFSIPARPSTEPSPTPSQ